MLSSGTGITTIEEITAGCFYMQLENKSMSEKAQPGQFLHIRTSSSLTPLLRRPFSIAGASPEKGLLHIFFRLRGEGTKILSRLHPGDTLDCLGPLGTGFRLGASDNSNFCVTQPTQNAHLQGVNSVLVGGGIGVAPLLFLAQTLYDNCKDRKITLFYGAPGVKELIPVHKFLPPGVSVELATDDGSAGYKGLVTELCLSHFQQGLQPQEIFACGPPQMLQKLAAMEIAQNIGMQFSLEERMACGVGACLGCAVKTRSICGDETVGLYKRVCKDGPVFNAREVIW